jgi:lipooligosaccharide transport system permease protein
VTTPIATPTAPRRGSRRFPTPKPLRCTAYFLQQYRRIWRGSLATNFVYPLLYLSAMGLGLGSLLAHRHRLVEGVTYLTFLAPGLLASTAMQVAGNESTYPVMDSIKWHRIYFAMLATPLDADDVLYGHLIWALLRTAAASALFLGVMALFGTVHSPWGAAVLPAGVLIGYAFAAPIFAFSARQESEAGFATLYRLGLVPLFLFSGTFYPVAQFPGWLQGVAKATPLYHGVSLVRDLSLGRLSASGDLEHLAYLLALGLVGTFVARRTYRSRLVR